MMTLSEFSAKKKLTMLNGIKCEPVANGMCPIAGSMARKVCTCTY